MPTACPVVGSAWRQAAGHKKARGRVFVHVLPQQRGAHHILNAAPGLRQPNTAPGVQASTATRHSHGYTETHGTPTQRSVQNTPPYLGRNATGQCLEQPLNPAFGCILSSRQVPVPSFSISFSNCRSLGSCPAYMDQIDDIKRGGTSHTDHANYSKHDPGNNRK